MQKRDYGDDMKTSKGEKLFYIVNEALLTLMVLLIIYPVVYVVAASFSGRDAIIQGRVFLFPVDFTAEAYKYLFADSSIWISYLNAIYYTVVGTAISLVVTICGAYPLSKSYLKGNGIMSFFVSITLWFGAGMIPTFLNFRDLGLLNTRLVMLIGFACNTFNFVLMRNFFSSVPKALEEAAMIDGASQWRILTQIYLPLSTSSIATITLFYAVAKWNQYLWPMILLQDENMMPIQVVSKKLIVDMQGLTSKGDAVDTALFSTFSEEGLLYAGIVVSALPMLILYPFIQKYFTKGVMVGAVKG